MSAAPENKRRMALTAALAALVVAGMTGLAFAATPLYQAFCKLTGYGGATQTASAAPSVVLARTVEVRFDANISPDLPVSFAPEQRSQTLRLGETGLAFYTVRNLSDHPVTAMATYNVTPHSAGQHFVKLECFCFQERVLAPGESAELPVVYFVDATLASDPDTETLETVTLSYTFFNKAEAGAALRGGAR
jgi:cytochrome c oxidase assembly protein subunit 11